LRAWSVIDDQQRVLDGYRVARKVETGIDQRQVGPWVEQQQRQAIRRAVAREVGGETQVEGNRRSQGEVLQKLAEATQIADREGWAAGAPDAAIDSAKCPVGDD
jgi:hypothetical protein